MKLITEYLLSKKNPTIKNGFDNICINAFKLIFEDENINVSSFIKKWIKNHEFSKIRIWWYIGPTKRMNEQFYKHISEHVFENIMEMKNKYILAEVCDDFANNENFDEEYIDEYSIKYTDVCIEIDNDCEKELYLELLDDEEEVNPSLSQYSVCFDHYIQISSRKILLEIGEFEWSDHFEEVYNMYVNDYLGLLEEKFEDIEFKALGSGSKHLCIKPTFKALHNLNKITKEVEIQQENLITDLKEEVEYMKENSDY